MKRIDQFTVEDLVNKLFAEDHDVHRYLFQRNAALTESIQNRAWETHVTLGFLYEARGRIR